MILQSMSEEAKRGLDAAAVLIPVATWINALPTIAAVLSIVWLGLRIAIAIMEHRVKKQEHLLNARKIKAQDDEIKSFRAHLNDTLKEDLPPRFKRLLDELK